MKIHYFMRQQPAAALVAVLGGLLVAVNLAWAQAFQPDVLASFNGDNGATPQAGLTQDGDGNFYGTTVFGGNNYGGGESGFGTIFQITTNGVLTTLSYLDGYNANPVAGLTLGSDGNFYGTAAGDALYGFGSVFQVTTNGVLTTLVLFAYTNGDNPLGALTLGTDGSFYGTTARGGTGFAPYWGDGLGTVFQVATNGVLTTLVSFDLTNGATPSAGLTLGSDGNFYGTTYNGGDLSLNADGFGTVFRVGTNGVLTTLVSFAGTNGAHPQAALTLGSDGKFYGTTVDGGIGFPTNWDGGNGTVFQVTTNGVLTTLVSFAGTNGANPLGALARGSDDNFYGTTAAGTVFQLTTNGVLMTLASFGSINGGTPYSGLTLGSDGNFYGTTVNGGTGYGNIYRLRRSVSIQSFGMATNGFQLNTMNVGGSGWVVLESSSDLTHWTPVQTNGTAAAQQFLDPTALAKPHQFYRVRQR
jgi:uncharacterized repeat protein (TIGR03803 family)